MWFYNLGIWIFRHKWIVIGAWLLAVIISAPFVPRVIEPLKTGGFADPDLEAAKAASLLQQKLGYSTSTLVIFYQSTDKRLNALDAVFVAEVQASLAALSQAPIKNNILLHTANPRQISKDGHTAYEVVTLQADGETATKRLPEIRPLITAPPNLKMTVGGGLACPWRRLPFPTGTTCGREALCRKRW